MSCMIRRDERGAAAVELALVLPILISLLFGMVEFGRGYNAKITLTHAAREGARAAAIGKPVDEVVDTVQAAASSLSIADGDVSVSACTAGEPVTVTVTYPFEFIVPMFGANFDLESKGTMRCNG